MYLIYLLYLSSKLTDWRLFFVLFFNFSRNINQIKTNNELWPVYKTHALYISAGK